VDLYKNFLLKNQWARKVPIYMKACTSWYSANLNLLKSRSLGVGRGLNREDPSLHVFILEKIFKILLKKSADQF
jgi:hypothetical protein